MNVGGHSNQVVGIDEAPTDAAALARCPVHDKSYATKADLRKRGLGTKAQASIADGTKWPTSEP